MKTKKLCLATLVAFLTMSCFGQKQNVDETFPRKGYVAHRFPQNGSDISSQYIQHEKIGYPLQGYYIENSGEKTEAVIVYQEPEKLLYHSFQLAICKAENNQKADYLNPQSEPNFLKFVDKSTLRAFFVGGQLFVQSTPGKWHILLNEGAIRDLIYIQKMDRADGTSWYQVADLIQKLDESPTNKSAISLGFKKSMSALVSEHAELASKIQLKESGYTFMYIDKIIREYNFWYDQQFPGKVTYLFSESGNNISTLNTEQPSEAEIVNAPAYTLPEAFSQLNQSWTFNKLIEGNTDMTNEYEKGFFNGQPMRMTLLDDGTIAYQRGYYDQHQIEFAQWEYIYPELRENSEIDFAITLYKTGGAVTKELYSLISVTASELVFENKQLQLRFVYVITTTQETVPSVKTELPEKYNALIGNWTFSKATQGDKNVSQEFKWYFDNGNPITLSFQKDGTIVYPKSAEENHKITGGSWEYIPDSERNLQLKTIMTDGSATQNFKIITIIDTLFIYEDTRSKVQFIFVRP